jgi:DNA-binding NarL/FixJ family response regulator
MSPEQTSVTLVLPLQKANGMTTAPERRSIWVVEDDERFGNQLAHLINLSDVFECQRVLTNCEDALARLEEDVPPDVILMDIGLPGMSGIEGIGRVKAIAPSIQVVMLTVFEDADNIIRAIGAGASGYLHKGSSLDVIVDSLKSIVDGGAPINPQIARKVLDMFARVAAPPTDYGLTAREKEVLTLLVDGHIKKQIAEKLFVSFNTVDKHVRNIYNKLQVQTRSGVVAKVLKERLL